MIYSDLVFVKFSGITIDNRMQRIKTTIEEYLNNTI
jgi:hypothetical protein